MSDSNRKKSETYLTPNQVAELLLVSPVTVRHWALEGRLKFVTTPGGHRRYARSDIEQFAQGHAANLSTRDSIETLRLLVVDDNRDLVDLVSELLATVKQPIVKEFAFDGFEAGDKLHTFKPNVVLLDLMMPGLDGFDTCRRIKQNPLTRDIRVIAMTGYPTDENIHRILQAGAETCLAKPFRAPALFAALGIANG